MPRLETMPNPADPTQELTAWAWAHVTNFDHGSKVIVVDWQYFASHAAAYTPGAAPILHRTQVFRPEADEAATPRVPSYDEIMGPILAGAPINVLDRVDQLGVEAFGGVAIPAGPPAPPQEG